MASLFNELYAVSPSATSMVAIVLGITLYVMAKAVLWWFLFGTGKLLFGKISLAGWIGKTVQGMVWGVVLVLMNIVFYFGFSPGSTVYMGALTVAFLLAFRIMWREFFTLFGLLRGDWNPFHPRLRFFAWNTFNIFFMFKPFKLLQSPFSTTNEQSKETPWGSMTDFCEWVYSYRQVGNVA